MAAPIDLAGPVGAAGPKAVSRPEADRLRETAQDFEAMFLHQMLSAMRQGLAEDNPLGGPNSPFGSLLQDEQAKIIAKAGGIGVAESILAELLKTQEAP
ncbi:MAG: rod-binding protein [Pseudomonadota bacterium]